MAFCPVGRAFNDNSVDENTVDVVYLDSAKAFDAVNHRCLLAKLEPFGLWEKVGRLIMTYPTGRTGCN